MITITMSAKGQFVLPKAVRESLKLFPGCKVEVSVDEKGRLILTPSLHEPGELFRDRPPVKRVLSVEDMDDAIRKVSRGRI
jgi:AbrB family looped-hinge helix DNA binding protein